MARAKQVAESISRLWPFRLLRRCCEALLRHYPSHVGFDAIALSKPLRFLAMGERFRLVRLRSGAQTLVFTKEHVGRLLMYMGDMDPRITSVLKRVLKPGDNVLDIGANVGWFTITAAQLVGRNGIVHSYEPQPDLAALLRASAVINGMTNVTVHECGLSATDGAMDLYLMDGNMGAASLHADAPGERHPIKVPVRHAGQALADLQLDRVRVLKIDVEGHEPTVLSAARGALASMRPEIVIFESNHDPRPLLERKSFKILASIGYRIFGFERSGALTEQVEGGKPLYSNDYVALHQGASYARNAAALGL